MTENKSFKVYYHALQTPNIAFFSSINKTEGFVIIVSLIDLLDFESVNRLTDTIFFVKFSQVGPDMLKFYNIYVMKDTCCLMAYGCCSTLFLDQSTLEKTLL